MLYKITSKTSDDIPNVIVEEESDLSIIQTSDDILNFIVLEKEFTN